MRLALALLLAALTGLPASAQTDGRLDLSRPGAGALGLRGAGDLAPEASGAAGAAGEATSAPGTIDLNLRPLAGPVLMSSPPPPDAQACRMSCAQTYYFCLADNASDECPQAWGQCRLGCGPGGGGAPAV
ncbi:hypothetical protein [Phenylobacterium sp.]|uniref:hypothetical protein n=1 Tax=Phenylobacterium sp. TaxID=1871053 RepID=UPI00272F0490|nr:hypothetical protein [Phenylobacterium sp.]MDP1617184.1 hypothetical protein [Phenylobacterium sp.]MDP1988604.1 hypothetical protein [Phenylobacterium sp.]